MTAEVRWTRVKRNTFDLAELTGALDRASRGVLHVRTSTHAVCTGWLITDRLVVLPSHALARSIDPHAPRISCRAFGDTEPAVDADVVSVSGAYDGSAPALLRLREALPGVTALGLASEEPQVEDRIFVLHYPYDLPRQQVSFGQILGVNAPWLRHDAETSPGSSGGPVVDARGDVVAMTTLGDPDGNGAGPSLGAILGVLREGPCWEEINERHRLADVAAARRRIEQPVRHEQPVSDALLRSVAVRWSVDPATLPPGDRDRVARLVTDPTAATWTLRPAERSRIIATAGSMQPLREARGEDSADQLPQRVIDRILAGPPYRLGDIEERALPYWLQAVHWFADVEPALPGPAEVARALERRRLRSRITGVAGADFRGRAAELSRLRRWYRRPDPAPIVVSGIGGIGKSALVARFVGQLPERALLGWLDFDRADLAPDDADSVLSMLYRQLAAQVDGFAPEPLGEKGTWQDRAGAFAAAFAEACRARPAPLLVLDGFEVAQYVRRHGEIWHLLELILERVEGLRVIISGRAPVPGLTLRGRPAAALPLAGLQAADAADWLRDHGIADPAVLARVLALANGIPLALRLAARFLDSGAQADELPEHLPQAMVEGLLYARILERVMEPALVPIARDALVLRRITAEIVANVLADRIPDGLDAGRTFQRLTRELSLVAGGDADQLGIVLDGAADELRLRPDVRAATLELLRRDDPGRVRTIDERAEAWYAALGSGGTVATAELVYHRLRLGDLDGAEAAWRDACGPLLAGDEAELPVPAQAWLHRRVAGRQSASVMHAAWEADAVLRIRDALARDMDRAVPEILDERSRRDPGGPLILYDAWMMEHAGDPSAARDLLASASPGDDTVQRDRSVLAALLASRAGDRPAADRLLVGLCSARHWSNLQDADLLALAAWAARVRLTVDLETERDLLLALGPGTEKWFFSSATSNYLTPSDLLLNGLATLMRRRYVSQSVELPTTPAQLEPFRAHLGEMRRGPFSPATTEWLNAPFGDPDGPWRAMDLGMPASQITGTDGLTGQVVSWGLDLAVLGERRWRLATQNLSLVLACRETVRRKRADPLRRCLGATLAAFRSQPLVLREDGHDFGSLDSIIATHLVRATPVLAARNDARGRLADELLNLSQVANARDPQTGKYRLGKVEQPDIRAILLYLLGPDPLETLFRVVAGLPLEES
ncbi:MAG TPA: trypsin-like peptidase domain-containing protein [Rugosimonospora sp.]